MLKDEVVQAVKEKTFHIYAVSRVEEALELLTNVPFGLPKADGTFDENTLAFRLKQRFQEANTRLRALEARTSAEEGK